MHYRKVQKDEVLTEQQKEKEREARRKARLEEKLKREREREALATYEEWLEKKV